MLWDRCLSVLSLCPACNVDVLWPNGWMHQDELGVEVGLGPDDIVLNGDPAPPPQRGTANQFSAHVCCGQTAGWIKMPPGRSRPRRHCVTRGPSLSHEKGGTAAPTFWPMSIVAKRLDESRCHLVWRRAFAPWLRPHCVRWDPARPHIKGAQTPNFWPIYVVAKRWDGSRCHLVRR